MNTIECDLSKSVGAADIAPSSSLRHLGCLQYIREGFTAK